MRGRVERGEDRGNRGVRLGLLRISRTGERRDIGERVHGGGLNPVVAAGADVVGTERVDRQQQDVNGSIRGSGSCSGEGRRQVGGIVRLQRAGIDRS